jgi:Uncharacterized protein conserved in bacteria (DUF2213)
LKVSKGFAKDKAHSTKGVAGTVGTGTAKITDRVGLTSLKTHPTTGVVSVSGRLTRHGLFVYGPGEVTNTAAIIYRSLDTISDPAFLESVRGSLASPSHEFTSIEKPVSGLVTRAEIEGDFVGFDMSLFDAEVIKSIQGGIRDVSAGYTFSHRPVSKDAAEQLKATYPGDWAEIGALLGNRPVVWLEAFDLRANHVTPVPRGRAGSACGIDSVGDFSDPIRPNLIPIEGSTPVQTTEEANEQGQTPEAMITDIMEDLLYLMAKLHMSMNNLGQSLDSDALIKDRAAYVGELLTGLGVVARDVSFEVAIDLIAAYSSGYVAGQAKDAATVAAAEPVATEPVVAAPAVETAMAADAVVAATVATVKVQVEPNSKGVAQTRQNAAWNRLTKRVSTTGKAVDSDE